MHQMFCSLVLLILLILGLWGKNQDSTYDGGHRGYDRFHGADHFDFAILLSGLETQCYWHFARQTGRFYLNHMLVSGVIADTHIVVSIFSPKGILISFTDDAKGQKEFQVQETGFYQMCFSNSRNRFGDTRVFLNFGVYYEDIAKVRNEREIKEGILNSTISNIKGISTKLQVRIQHMWRFYNVAHMRKVRDYYLLQSKSNYMRSWSILQSFIIIMAGCLQLCVLKMFFRTQSSRDRPRC